MSERHVNAPAPPTCLPAALAGAVPRGRAERVALAAGLALLTFATSLTAAASLAVPPVANHGAVVARLAGHDVCPDGWAAAATPDAAAEAQVMARYVAATFAAEDAALLRTLAARLDDAATGAADVPLQIALCVAASRGLVGPTAAS